MNKNSTDLGENPTASGVNLELKEKEIPIQTAIELDMTNFMEQLSDEYICGKPEVREDNGRTNSNRYDCMTKNSTDLGENATVSGVILELKEKVRNSNTEVVFSLSNIII